MGSWAQQNKAGESPAKGQRRQSGIGTVQSLIGGDNTCRAESTHNLSLKTFPSEPSQCSVAVHALKLRLAENPDHRISMNKLHVNYMLK